MAEEKSVDTFFFSLAQNKLPSFFFSFFFSFFLLNTENNTRHGEKGSQKADPRPRGRVSHGARGTKKGE